MQYIQVGKYNDKKSQISCSYICPTGTYSFKGSINCQKCPGGYKGIKSQAISLQDGCIKCPNGTYSNDNGGHITCTKCKREGYFCPEGAIKEELCTLDEYCDGKTKQKRPNKPVNIIVKKKQDENAINATWEMNWNNTNKGAFDIFYTTNKDIPTNKMNKIEFDIEILNKKSYSFEINNLNVGTKYFVRVISVQYNDEIIYPDKVRINLDYYYQSNLWIDIKIIFATAWVILFPGSNIIFKILKGLPEKPLHLR